MFAVFFLVLFACCCYFHWCFFFLFRFLVVSHCECCVEFVMCVAYFWQIKQTNVCVKQRFETDAAHTQKHIGKLMSIDVYWFAVCCPIEINPTMHNVCIVTVCANFNFLSRTNTHSHVPYTLTHSLTHTSTHYTDVWLSCATYVLVAYVFVCICVWEAFLSTKCSFVSMYVFLIIFFLLDFL